MMTIDERIERLTARVEGLVMTAELHQKELQTIGSHIQADAENIRALARIAEIHERRLEAIEGDQS
jgi:archaellum component FlaC